MLAQALRKLTHQCREQLVRQEGLACQQSNKTYSLEKLLTVLNKSSTCGANARLQLFLKNSTLKKGHNYVKNIMRVTCPIGMGCPFDSKQLV